MLTQVDADKILATPKFVIDKGKPCNTFHLDLVKNKSIGLSDSCRFYRLSKRVSFRYQNKR